MNVRAKFRCIEKNNRTSIGGYGAAKPADTSEVKLQAVAGPENAPWSKYTPSGELRMQITNPEALSAFEVGVEYFIDITPVLALQVEAPL